MKVDIADSAGATSATLAALCCSGNAVILASLNAVGLGFLRKDAILWPLMLLSLAVALWGLWRSRAMSPRPVPIVLGSVGALSLAAGVIFVHGPPAMAMIYGGAVGLLLATLLNARARRVCAVRTQGPA